MSNKRNTTVSFGKPTKISSVTGTAKKKGAGANTKPKGKTPVKQTTKAPASRLNTDFLKSAMEAKATAELQVVELGKTVETLTKTVKSRENQLNKSAERVVQLETKLAQLPELLKERDGLARQVRHQTQPITFTRFAVCVYRLGAAGELSTPVFFFNSLHLANEYVEGMNFLWKCHVENFALKAAGKIKEYIDAKKELEAVIDNVVTPQASDAEIETVEADIDEEKQVGLPIPPFLQEWQPHDPTWASKKNWNKFATAMTVFDGTAIKYNLQPYFVSNTIPVADPEDTNKGFKQ